MTVKEIFAPHQYATIADVALLLLRLTCGLAFMLHGWGKIQHPLKWMGPDGFAPPFFQALAAFSEFGGGLAWILGLLTPLASLGIVSTMSTAVWFHAISRGDPFVSNTGEPAFELAAVYLSVALALISIGPGRFSLDRAIFGKKGEP